MKTIFSQFLVSKIDDLSAKILGKSMFSKDDSLTSCTCGHCYTYSEPPLQELSNDVQICHQISKMQKIFFQVESNLSAFDDRPKILLTFWAGLNSQWTSISKHRKNRFLVLSS
ncbi:MAG: hypothetical protein IPK55_10675 [Streptococcus sp.]|nr:hypothetical protein [Streptococcus sp.]